MKTLLRSCVSILSLLGVLAAHKASGVPTSTASTEESLTIKVKGTAMLVTLARLLLGFCLLLFGLWLAFSRHA